MPPTAFTLRLGVLLQSALCMLLLSACAQQSSPLFATLKALVSPASAANETRLDPQYEHLRVALDGRSAFVTLGDIDKQPDGDRYIYYGGGGLVLRLHNGRLAGFNGLVTEWRNVGIHGAPAWSAAQGRSLQWNRTRDVMPGYHYGISETMLLTPVAAPRKNPLWETSMDGLLWFQEDIIATNASNSPNTPNAINATNATNATKGAHPLPPARYAVSYANNQATVVYGEQCIAPATCLTWQRWTPRQK